MSGVPVERLKAFMDVSSEDAKAYARWGASTFAKQQFRATTSNSVNPSAEPLSMEMPTQISHANFLDLISPSWDPKES
eukprot:5763535-Amphidinium_carterae.1